MGKSEAGAAGARDAAAEQLLATLPRLDQPIGPLQGGEPCPEPAVAAGRRAAVVLSEPAPAGGAALDVWVHPWRLARSLRVSEAGAGHRGDASAAAVEVGRAGSAGGPEGERAGSQGGVERRLELGGGTVAERALVPAAGPVALLEWEAVGGAVELEIVWTVDAFPDASPDPDSGAPGAAPELTRAAAGLVVRSGRSPGLGVAAWSQPPRELRVEGGQVRARFAMPAGETVRLAFAAASTSAAGGEVGRALRSASKPGVIVRSRSGARQRLAASAVALHATDEDAGPRLAAALLRLLDHVVEVPGLGRSVVADYGGGPPEFRTASSVAAAVAAAAMGEREVGRDVLRFLGRHADADGRIPAWVRTDGRIGFDGAAGAWYLSLVGQYTAWTGDLATVRAEWERVRRVVRGGHGSPTDAEARWARAAAGLVPVAESVGDAAMAAELRRRESSAEPTDDVPPLQEDGGVAGAAREVRAVIRGLLGAEPDATRGRLVLRPRPPAGWDRWVVRSLPVGEAAVGVEYTREGPVHRLRAEQQRGGAPVQLVLAPEVPGRLVGARVDGRSASLSPVPAGDRVRVPVQLVLDAPRTLELEMAPDSG